MSKILFLSNGHGEDISGSLLAKKLIKHGHKIHALPLVGNGNSYKNNGVRIVGITREFNTAGLGYNSLNGRLKDLINGQIIYFLKKLFFILYIHRKYDYFFVVGDIVPIFFAWLVKKEYFLYLVAYSSNYEGKLNLPWPCKFFLDSKKVKKIYSRDYLTAIDLSKQLRKDVKFLGNPFMDKLFLIKTIKKKNKILNIALLPGSRIIELKENLILMLELLENLSRHRYFEKKIFNFALINQFDKDNLKLILQERNWTLKKKNLSENNLTSSFKNICVNFCWNSFEGILNNTDLVIGMAGTANEQAVGLAKPLIQLEGKGPQFTKKFAEAQRRLLGEYVYCVTEYINRKHQLNETVKLILKIIYLIKLDNKFLLNCRRNAISRLGEKGASDNLINDMKDLLI